MVKDLRHGLMVPDITACTYKARNMEKASSLGQMVALMKVSS